MFVRVDGVIAAIDQSHFKIDERISGNGPRCCCLKNAFLDRRPEVLRNAAAKDLIDPFKTFAAPFWLKYDLAISKLSASAGLFLVSTLNLDRLRDGFLIRDLRRVKCDLDVESILQFVDDGLYVQLSLTGKNKFLC